MSFGIRNSNFMMLEVSTLIFLHGCWNYYFIKTDIDVMMLFNFDIKYVKLKFKAIASMVFSFDLKLNLLCSYDGSLLMKNRWKLFGKNSGKFNFTSFDRSRIPFDRSIEQESRIDQVKQIVYAEFIKISTNWEFLSIDRICFFDRSNRNRESIESSRLFIKIFFMISIDWKIHSIDRKLRILNFH